ncbi:MAG: hypothetical protein HY040_04395 [Planctomycetes bacterium]|nr:hypothetical protein [Planctomycetota bacterium]
MPDQLPCPNPTCSHVFSAAQVQAATALACPRCGQVFQLRQSADGTSSASPPAPPRARPRPAAPADASAPTPWYADAAPPAGSAPVAKAKPAVPVAKPVPRAPVPRAPAAVKKVAPPLAPPSPTPVAAVPRPTQASPPPNIAAFDVLTNDAALVSSAASLHRRQGLKRFLVPIFALVAAVGIIGGIFYGLHALELLPIKGVSSGTNASSSSESAWNMVVELRNEKKVSEKVCRLILPKKSWESDAQLKQRMGVALAYRFQDTDDPSKAYWCAVHAKDFGVYKPRDAELLSSGIERLSQYFGESLETEAQVERIAANSLSAQRITFKGQIHPVSWWGDMYFLTENGIGYWFYVAAPTRDEAREAFKSVLSDGAVFVVENERRGWREKPQPVNTFRGTAGAVTLTAQEGVFTKYDAKDEDEKALLFLFGRHLKEQTDILKNRKNAHVLVLGLEKAGDLSQSFKAARDYVEADFKKIGEYKLTAAEEGKDGPTDTGDKVDVSSYRGRIGEFQVQLKDEVKRYIMLVVVNQEETTYAVRCECPWESRSIWRQDFLDLLATFKLKAGKSAVDE